MQHLITWIWSSAIVVEPLISNITQDVVVVQVTDAVGISADIDANNNC